MESEYLKSERQRAALLQLVFILAEVAEVLRSSIQFPTRGRRRGSRGEPEEMQHLPPAPRNKCPVLWQRQGIPLSHTATGSRQPGSCDASSRPAPHRHGRGAANPGGRAAGAAGTDTAPFAAGCAAGLGPGIIRAGSAGGGARVPGSSRVAKPPERRSAAGCTGNGLGLGLGPAPSAPGLRAATATLPGSGCRPPPRLPFPRPAPGLLSPHMPSKGEEEDGV